MRRGRGARLLLALVMVAAVVMLSACAAASGSPPPAHTAAGSHPAGSVQRAQAARPASTYLALGDSVAFGYRPPPVVPFGAYQHPSRFRSYAADVATKRELRLVNASCPGETTASMINPSKLSYGCENRPGSPIGYRDIYPLHVPYTGSQLHYAVSYLKQHPQTRLVTIDIGANDMFLCRDTNADRCRGSDFLAALQQVSGNLSKIFAALRNDAGYTGQIVLLDYYALDYRNGIQTTQVRALNAALIMSSVYYWVQVADGFGAFLRASSQSGGDPCAAGLLVKLPGGTCNVHPSAAGHRVLAKAIRAATTP